MNNTLIKCAILTTLASFLACFAQTVSQYQYVIQQIASVYTFSNSDHMGFRVVAGLMAAYLLRDRD